MEYIKEIAKQLQTLDEEKDKKFLVQVFIIIRVHKEKKGS